MRIHLVDLDEGRVENKRRRKESSTSSCYEQSNALCTIISSEVAQTVSEYFSKTNEFVEDGSSAISTAAVGEQSQLDHMDQRKVGLVKHCIVNSIVFLYKLMVLYLCFHHKSTHRNY